MVGNGTVLLEYSGSYFTRPKWSHEVLSELGLTCDILFDYAVYGAQCAMDSVQYLEPSRLLPVLSDIMYNDLDDQVGRLSQQNLMRLDELVILATVMANELLPALRQIQYNAGRDVSFDYVEFNHDTIILHMEY